MELQQILERYRDDSRISELEKILPQAGKATLLHAISSQIALFAAGFYLKTSWSSLFLLPDFEEAAYFENDIKQLLPQGSVLFLPSSYKKDGQYHELDNNRIQQRAQVIDELMRARKAQKVVVTYPEALMELTVTAKTLQENTLHLHVGEKVDVDFMLDLLIEYGFERTDFVYEPGEFSIRGGIIDIFSFGNEYPYRIELFDKEVESMRTFDPESQLSQRKISELTIIPNIRTHFTEQHFAPFFEFLPATTTCWVKEPIRMGEVLNTAFDNLRKELEDAAAGNDEPHPLQGKTLEQLVMSPEEIFLELDKRPCIFTGAYEAPKDGLAIDMKGKPQPSFNRNFQFLIQHLQQNQAADIHTCLLSENLRQLERLRMIFDDLKAAVPWSALNISLSAGFTDEHLNLSLYTDHQIFERFHRYQTKKGFSRGHAITIKALKDLNPGDYVTHIDHGVGVFSGLQRLEINGQIQEAVRIIYADNDILYVNINSLHKISKYSGKEGQVPKVHKLGSDVWQNLKNKTKKKIKDIAKDLIALYARRKMEKGFAFSRDNYLQAELEASFIYEDTPDQERATADVKADMEKPYPMDRLICGDVGFGKTEVAVRAAFKAVNDSKQVAVLVPTTILAWQHFKTFSGRLADFPVTVDYINRFKSAREKKDTLNRLKEGKVDIIVGTHALLSREVQFKDLGLLIIDEEQKFGVAAKEKLKALSVGVDTLTLTATPIPRTLKFSMMGARDLSNILTPPPNRQPVTTEVHVFNPEIIRDAIEHEVFRGGQVFFVHNKVKDLLEVASMIRNMVPGVEVRAAHGQMEGDELEDVMLDFINGKFDVLVSTNIIESGLDIPNANTIIINNAQHFGLSDLHQMRGRVGRSNKKAFCYLLSPPKSMLTPEARKRLQTLEEFSDLGSGFHISMRDMDIRGAGNLLGSEQSGFIADIGFDMYHKILDEAIQELKHTEFKELFKDQIAAQQEFVRDCSIEADVEMLIPNDYVSNAEERLKLYSELDELRNEEELTRFKENLKDRFGPIPKPVLELFDGLRIRWMAKQAGFERIILKNGKLRCYFIDNPNSPFYESAAFQKVMTHIQQGRKAILKQSKDTLILIYEDVWSMHKAEKILEEALQVDVVEG